ncbi:single-stranded-DNA-specific exonuclease RecJ [Salinisphaera sp. Q1T1-3]|uniref:single-stranded-DNA-specific exonuclease RecJ n=1 Tax=Salinisphaera sp. Q1T1-3 TaxID=2321229 RepID=UPI000E738449|nr:single-stranded-DNA-specific exonuclease RecJ [Salinisphaera sp. Q1T1-3]RJS95410.1 single-stranded-DNA-specific exonuclease RecJ [Salinisphaera sp. Q1T1-3]
MASGQPRHVDDESPRIVERELTGDVTALAYLGQPLLARIYAGRGIADPAELDYALSHLPDFSALKGVDGAVSILCAAIDAGAPICVVGDFDADGATSTTLALEALSACGAVAVDHFMPQRATHGYGLSPSVVEALGPPSAAGAVLLTVDNGIAAHAGVTAARAAGWRVVITDHHLPGDTLPADAEAVVNPNQPGCEFASKRLAGVGVVFYLMAALRARRAAQGATHLPRLGDFLDLVAVGTVADVVPLDHLNRTLVAQGLRRIRAGRGRPGIVALADIAGRDHRRLTPDDIGFAIGPRINAAGRLDDMAIGVHCLRAADPDTARAAAEQLSAINRDRRRAQRRMVADAEQALAHLSLSGTDMPAGLVVHGADWHEGIVGLIAARVRERVHRPVVAFAPGANGELKGSARSIPGVHVRDILAAIDARHAGLIRRFGGHAQAAGLSLAAADLDDFRQAFDTATADVLTPALRTRAYLTDGELSAGDFTLETAKRLRDAGPWGAGFEAPLFHGRFHILSQRIVGEHHLKLRLSPAAGDAPAMAGIWFNREETLEETIAHRLVFQLAVNEFRGQENLDLIVVHAEPA